jgi:hypothetical protein
MTAKIYTVHGGERNTRLIMTKRLAILARPDIQEQIRECEALIAARHVHRLLSKTHDLPRNSRR